MVQYSLDNESIRVRILFAIASISVLISPVIASLVPKIGASAIIQIGTPLALAPSAMTLFFISLWIFDKWIWCFLGINKFFSLPNLNGDWKGIVTTPGEQEGELIETECILKVIQTFLKISITLETEGSFSRTIIAGIEISNPQQVVINFAYEVRSTGAKRIKLKERGEGFNSLKFRSTNKKLILEGGYFSDVIYEGEKKPHSGYVCVEKVKTNKK